jgi:hypothetical protein
MSEQTIAAILMLVVILVFVGIALHAARQVRTIPGIAAGLVAWGSGTGFRSGITPAS